MKIYKIGIDIKRELARPIEGINTGDSVVLCVTLTDGGEIYDFTGVNIIELSSRLKDYTNYTIDVSENLIKSEPERGYLEFNIPQAFVSDGGMHKLQITLFKEDKKMATAQASYYVEESLNDGNIIPDEDTLKTYDDLIKKVSNELIEKEKGREQAEEKREAEIEKLKSMEASAVSLEAGEVPTAVLNKEEEKYSLTFGIPKGEKGERGPQGVQGVKGDSFEIYKTYTSADNMNNDADNVPEGKFVLIASNVEDEDNAKLYVKSENRFSFLTDMSGAKGIQGERGEQGVQGEKGEKGDTPQRGVDYWTEEDKAEIVKFINDKAVKTLTKEEFDNCYEDGIYKVILYYVGKDTPLYETCIGIISSFVDASMGEDEAYGTICHTFYRPEHGSVHTRISDYATHEVIEGYTSNLQASSADIADIALFDEEGKPLASKKYVDETCNKILTQEEFESCYENGVYKVWNEAVLCSGVGTVSVEPPNEEYEFDGAITQTMWFASKQLIMRRSLDYKTKQPYSDWVYDLLASEMFVQNMINNAITNTLSTEV